VSCRGGYCGKAKTGTGRKRTGDDARRVQGSRNVKQKASQEPTRKKMKSPDRRRGEIHRSSVQERVSAEKEAAKKGRFGPVIAAETGTAKTVQREGVATDRPGR